ncbi:MAG: hypothetical protein HY059_19455 [Proteobacteria bacterium]|nr:hypothetical protein [Pseudomonadota bacterium]
MRLPNPILLVPVACVVFMASCGPSADNRQLVHPSLPPAEQTAIRSDCTREAQGRLGPAPASTPPTACREDGDPAARDRCKAQSDLALITQTRYILRLDIDVAACLRARGFRD